MKHNCDVWFVNGELIDTTRKGEKKEYVDLSDMLPLEGDEEEVEQQKGLKNVTPDKLLTRFPILLRQIKAENNSYKLRNGIRQILYLLYQHNKIIKRVYNNLIKSWNNGRNMIIITDPKTFYFDFDWPKDFKENLMHEIEFIIKSNESLTEN